MTVTQNHARAGLVEHHEAAACAGFTETDRGHRFRTPILALEGLLAVGGAVGTVQLMAGTDAPDLGVLEPLGLATWRLPALWLFLTVVVPSTWAAWLAWRRSPRAPTVVLLGAATLAIELVVQIPFLGWSVLQAIFGAVAVCLAVLAVQARRRGWDGSPPTSGVTEGRSVMKALVVFESMWGNTEKVAHAVAAGLAESMEVTTVDVSRAPTEAGAEFGLIVAGGPTHAFSMSRTRTRADAHNRGAPHGDATVGLRDWLDRLPSQPHAQAVATFDTRVTTVRHLPGSAAKAAAKTARRHGYDRVGHPESFYVHDSEGPLLDGELARATAWGRDLAAAVTTTAAPS